jgi:hypothetical protein
VPYIGNPLCLSLKDIPNKSTSCCRGGFLFMSKSSMFVSENPCICRSLSCRIYTFPSEQLQEVTWTVLKHAARTRCDSVVYPRPAAHSSYLMLYRTVRSEFLTVDRLRVLSPNRDNSPRWLPYRYPGRFARIQTR